jgi:hypothetical protein
MNERPAEAPPPGGLEVAIGPIGGPGGRAPRGPLPIAGGIGLVLVVAVVLARAFPAGPEPTTRVVVSASPVAGAPVAATASSVSAPRDVATPFAFAPRYRPADFVERVVDGSLDGYLVYADATLAGTCWRGAPVPCGPGSLSIDGLGLEVRAGDASRDGLATVPRGALLVLRVEEGVLVYLGSLIAATGASPPLTSLHPSGVDPASPVARQTLHDVGGWLEVHPACRIAVADTTSACVPGMPFLATDVPFANGTLRSPAGSVVAVGQAAWGIGQDDPFVPGPFLVSEAAGSDATWQVVARYDPSRSVRVVIP